MIYVDTSVIVAAIDPHDPRQTEARRILEKSTEGKVVSELVIAELASVISRRWNIVSKIAKRIGTNKDIATLSMIVYLLKRFGLEYRSVTGSTHLPFLGEVNRPMALAVEFSNKAKLKTLDLLHLAYVKMLKEAGVPITKVLTADRGFRKAKELLADLGIELNIIE